jgi:CubicO group peptidase (beta-lactamase class C family)
LNLTLPNRESGFSFLVRNFAAQDERFRRAFDILKNAIATHAFPACSLAITLSGELVAYKALGRFTYDPASPEAGTESIFDLASLTKVVASTAMAMILYERGLLDLEAPITAIVPEFAGDDHRRREITLRMLLAHSSGLPAYEKLFLRAKSREDLLQSAFTATLTASPGSRAEYSDIGYIVLGVALERIADESLAAFCQREIFGPLGMAHTRSIPHRP